VSDYKDVTAKLAHFWEPYIAKHGNVVDENSELSIDFAGKAICMVPKDRKSS